MKQFVLVLALILLSPQPVAAVDYRSNNYQVIVEPTVGTPFSSEPSVEVTGTGSTNVAFEYDRLIPSNFANSPLTADHRLTSTFYLTGSIYVLSNHRLQDENGLALPKWTNNKSLGLGVRINQQRRYQPLPSRADLEEPVKIGGGSSLTTLHFLVNYPISKREFVYSSTIKYFVVGAI